MERIRRLKTLIILVAIALIGLSLYSAWLSYIGENPGQFNLFQYFQTWLISIGPEAAGIALTILVIDYLNEKREENRQEYEAQQQEIREKKALRSQLIRELCSKDNAIALRALNELIALDLLEEDSLVKVQIPLADLTQARFQGCDMHGAWLDGAILCEANFSKANLSKASGSDVQFKQANFRGAKLVNAWLHHSNYQVADFERADLTGANLRFSNFRHARLEYANLSNADLNNCDFSKTDLRDAQFHGTQIDKANFTEADVRYADFSNAKGFNEAIFTRATYNDKTKWPAEFDYIKAGAIPWDPSWD